LKVANDQSSASCCFRPTLLGDISITLVRIYAARLNLYSLHLSFDSFSF
jgi:hypothetical protein